MKPLLLLALVSTTSLVLGACARNVSYRDQIQPVFNARCVDCHGTDHPQGKIVLASYDGVVSSKTVSGRAPLITPGNPGESRLFILCATAQAHFRMPPDTSAKTPLTRQELEALRDWIKQGAKNN
jgi:hypothetical protein